MMVDLFFQYTNFFVKEEMTKSWMVYIIKSLTKIWEIFCFSQWEINEQNNIQY